MIFDMNRAWRDAMEMLTTNREVLLIVAGLFFFLPSLTITLLVPTMQPPAQMAESEVFSYLVQFYTNNALWIIVMAVLQTVGMLTLLALLRDESRPTVGDALKTGVIGTLPYLGAQILFSFGLAVTVGLLLGIAIATGIKALIAVVIVLMLPVLIYAMVKMSLVPAVIAIEHEVNPITVLTRSWSLTRGNSFRLLLFYALLAIAFIVIMMVVSAVSGLLLTIAGGNTAAQIGEGVVSGLIGAAMTVLFAAILAAIHRQLAGPTAGAISRTFE